MSKQQTALRWSAVVALGCAFTAAWSPAWADGEAPFVPLPLLMPEAEDAALQKAGGPPALRPGTNLFSAGAEAAAIAQGQQQRFVLPIKFTDGVINNPATGKNDPVQLRSYGNQFVAPLIVMKPGQTVRIELRNQLPEEPDCAEGRGVNEPHCFNTTNLHSHGLWVSPTGNSDNVLLSLQPNVSFEYEYNVPVDHPAGTFWYHPHKHGSTAMQVGSGMAGALVIEGERPPRAARGGTPASNGDLDVLLKPFQPREDEGGIRAEVMLYQQVPYACFNDKGDIEKDDKGRWICKDGQTGYVKDFNKQMTGWATSGRYTTISGTARPTYTLNSGRLYRWRNVHAGIRESIALRIRKIGNAKRLNFAAASPAEREKEVARACTGVDVSQFEVAADGLTRSQAFEKTTNQLQPGYRSDVLFVLPEPGEYCVYDDSVPGAGSISAEPENAKIIAIIRAKGGSLSGSQREFVVNRLTGAAKMTMPADVVDQVVEDLKSLKLTKFVPHPEITEGEIKASGLEPVAIDFKIAGGKFMVNNEDYKPDRIDQTLLLHRAQTWSLTSSVGSHPFHIHVNPFQIVSVRKKGPDGKPAGPELTDGQYTGMLGTWKDTIFVQSDVVVETRTRYQRYIGEFVLHCHILDHEDRGMMQNVNIVLPDSQGRPTAAGHH